MAKTTLFHPIPLPSLRGQLISGGIMTSRITQVRYDPLNQHAEYDAVLLSVQECPYRADECTPKMIAGAIHTALHGNVCCDYIIWRKDHWIAHISTWIPFDKTPPEEYIDHVSDRPIHPQVGSDAWIAEQEGTY
jgi:hypothetical protein